MAILVALVPILVIIQWKGGISDMRHFAFSIMAVLALCLTTACQREVILDEPAESVHMITVHATHADTRTAIVYDNDEQKYKSTWEAGDWISLYELSGGDFTKYGWCVGDSHDNPLSADRTLTSFMVRFYNSEPLSAPLQYIGVSSPYYGATPINTIKDRDDWVEAWGKIPAQPRWGLRGYIPHEQTPTADCFDPDADLMFSQLIENPDTRPGEINLAFARVGSIAKITLKGLPKGGRVLDGGFRHDGGWLSTGRVYYDSSLGKVAYLSAPIKSAGENDGFIYFYNYNTTENLSINDEGEAVIWLRTFSGTLSDHFYITVTVVDGDGNEKEYEKYVDMGSRTIEFTEGDITAFNVVMEKR